MSRFKAVPGLVLLVVVSAGCSEPAAEEPAPSPPVAALAAPLRRLSAIEYRNTVRDLFRGKPDLPPDQLTPGIKGLGFDNNVAVLGVSPYVVEWYMQSAEYLAQRIDVRALAPCQPHLSNDRPIQLLEEAQCAERFIREFGVRAYRRPVRTTELPRLLETFTRGQTAGGYETGIRYLVQHMLQSPHFLYRVESGRSAEPGPRTPLTGWELASRLSYLLWQTMPDDELFEAAENQELVTRADVAAQAVRLLGDQRARETVASFHRQWLGIEDVQSVQKDRQAFPGFIEARPWLARETERFAVHVIFDGRGDLTGLLTAPYSFVHATTAALYDLADPPPQNAGLVLTPLDPTIRAGLLTQPSILSTYARAAMPSPVSRGLFVRERLLCQTIPPPPPGVDTNVSLLPAPDGGDPYPELSQNPACAGCHRRMNLIGNGFSRYDAVGRYRPLFQGKPAPDQGEVTGSDVGAFEGPVALGRLLAQSPTVQACVVRQFYLFASGRSEVAPDEATLQGLTARFQAGGLRIKDLLVDLTQTDEFMLR